VRRVGIVQRESWIEQMLGVGWRQRDVETETPQAGRLDGHQQRGNGLDAARQIGRPASTRSAPGRSSASIMFES